ncbi:MAG: hypothetical protein V4456_16675 [Bacteroidota bacterium]
MDANDSLNNFDYEGFMAREFPHPKGVYPEIGRLLEHFNKITGLLMDCALQSLKLAQSDQDKESVLHTNTRYTIVCNFRLRTINLIKVFSEILDIEGNAIFDEGTANVIARSLLESYLVYFRLYNGCGNDKEIQELYFNLYDLSSVLHFVKFAKSLVKIDQNKHNEINLKGHIKKLICDTTKNHKFRALPSGIQDSIRNIEAGKHDYLSFINFNKLIRESPLPTQFITSYYSYASSFAHSEGFSSSVSQMVFESKERWKAINEMLKFRLVYVCLAVSSQFFISYTEYDKTQLEDEREKDVWETLSLCNYYLEALNHNN